MHWQLSFHAWLYIAMLGVSSTASAWVNEAPGKPSLPAENEKPADRGGETKSALVKKSSPSNDDQTVKATSAETEELVEGHSYHGEAFDDGPRQKAYLMGNTGKVDFPVTTNSEEARLFILQGVGQLHGFWYFEAERSFRQAAAIDSDCAIAYWGMAMANINNGKRAQGFIAEAVDRKKNASRHEQLYIDALDVYWKADEKKKKERARNYIRALDRIVYEFPDDLNARAWIVKEHWENSREGVPIISYHGADALLSEIFEREPMHPAHHYRIHWWDAERPAKALESAAKCGPAAPGIAHMWHMPGHIYSKLRRYHDAAWQQEASARVDHAYMIRDRVLPDQIHNFAHNNEWLIRNYIYIGAWHDALQLAKNMVSLPRHPRWNTLDNKKCSAHYGRLRLYEVLEKFELADHVIALAETPYLEAPEDGAHRFNRDSLLATAYLAQGNAKEFEKVLTGLETLLADERAMSEMVESEAEAETRDKNKDDPKIEKLVKDAKAAARKPHQRRIRNYEKTLNQLRGLAALSSGDAKQAVELLKKAEARSTLLARAYAAAGNHDEAVKLVRNEVKSHANETVPLANLIEILWAAGKRDEARQSFEQLRTLSSAIELDCPPFARLAPIAHELGYQADWRLPRELPDDLGYRPPLDELGPQLWEPWPAIDWTLPNGDGQPVSMKQYRGRPVILIFYLGFGCLHCVEQLEAFAPMTQEFAEQGISLVAISTDDQAKLAASIADYGESKFPFALVSDAALDVFKAYRAYDEFEKQPLHGTFLIDAQGRVRWQDTGFEPFSDGRFLLQEAKRLLSLPFGADMEVQAE